MERDLGSYQVYRMESENHLRYSPRGKGRLFSKKLAVLALVLTLFSAFFTVNPAVAQQRLVCDTLMAPALGAPLQVPACLTVAPVTAVFPPGSIAPTPGMSLDAVSAPLVPVGNQSTVFNPCWWDPGFGCLGGNVNQFGLTPTPPTTPASSYPAGPFYGVAIQPGWMPSAPGGPVCGGGGGGSFQSQPASSYDGGNATLPTIIASQGLAPYGMRRDACWDPWIGYYGCGTVSTYGFNKPVDPIVFVPNGRAYMWPIGTNVISGGVNNVLTQQGLSTCSNTNCVQQPCIGWLPGGFCTSWNALGHCNGYSGTCNAWNPDPGACLCAVCTAWNPATPTMSIGAGDIVLGPMGCPPNPPGGTCGPQYDIGCPAGYVARLYDAAGNFTCLTMDEYMAAIPPICDYTVDPTCTGGIIIPPPPPPGVCVGAGCMTGPGSNLLPSLCDSGSYFGAFIGWLSSAITGIDPCNFTMDQLGLAFAQNFEGGEQFANYMEDWWFDDMLPDMKNMTTQWNVAILDQTLSLGQFMDASNQVEQQLKGIQANEDKNLERLKPSENTCSMASIAPGLQRALQTTRAVKSAMLQESAARALNLPGSGTENGRRVAHNQRWTNYCNVFADPADNTGITNGCAGAAALRGADINVERFLFRDTINLNDANERAAADALLQNLVDYWVTEPLYPGAQNTAQLERRALQRNHFAALRQAVVEPVAGIIARRAAIPNSGYEISVQDMRMAAGVPAALRHASPSYNEAVLARSKEYFMNLDTLLKSNVDIGPLRQDQVVNEALIAIMLEDIAEVEAQINTILAARMSMKLNSDEDELKKDFERMRPD